LSGRKKEGGPRSDRDLGIETTRHVAVSKLSIEGDNKAHASPYEPTPFGVLEDMLLELDIAHERYTFVDLGAGKGRVLCLASRWPWRRIIGVEAASALAKAAKKNAAAFSASSAEWQKCRKIEVIHADAAEWTLPPEPLVFFLFNPFGAAVIARVLDRIQASYEQSPRELCVLYYMPVHAALFARAPCLEAISYARDWTIWIASLQASR
jgi:predicted RNA methylase